MLFEVTYAFLTVNQQTKRQATTGLDPQVTDVGTNYRYGSRALNLGTTGSYIYVPRWQSQPGFTFSYVTGEHVFKAGTLLRYFHTGEASRNVDPNQINQGRDYTFRNGVPTNVTYLGGAVRVGGRRARPLVLRAGSVDARPDDAEPRRALQRRGDVAAGSSPRSGVLRGCTRAPGGEAPACTGRT